MPRQPVVAIAPTGFGASTDGRTPLGPQVRSTSLDAVDWPNASVNAQPVEEEIPRPKTKPGGDIVGFGGPSFAHSLIRHRLVDEYRLTVHPIALGHRSALMHGLPEPQRFERVSNTVYTDESMLQVLQPGS